MSPAPPEVTVQVASTRIVGGVIDLKAPAVAPFRLAAGGRVVIQHAYRLVEASPDKETWGFFLDVEPKGMPHKGAREIVRDRPLVTDDVMGALAVAYKFPKPGRHTVTFHAAAEYRLGSWTQRAAPMERSEASGSFTVLVEADGAAPASPAKKAATPRKPAKPAKPKPAKRSTK